MLLCETAVSFRNDAVVFFPEFHLDLFLFPMEGRWMTGLHNLVFFVALLNFFFIFFMVLYGNGIPGIKWKSPEWTR